MKAQIIQIGNSQGVRIPKMMLEETGLSGEVELLVLPDGILIRNAKKPRADWDAIFKSVPDVDDDLPVESEIVTEFDKREWQW